MHACMRTWYQGSESFENAWGACWQLLVDLATSTKLKTQLQHCEEQLATELAAKKEIKHTLTSRVEALQLQVAPLEARASESEWKCASAVLEKDAAVAAAQRLREDVGDLQARLETETGHLTARVKDLTQRLGESAGKLSKAQDQVVSLRALPVRLEAAMQDVLLVRRSADAEEKRLQTRIDELVRELAETKDKANTLLGERDAKLVDADSRVSVAQQDKKRTDGQMATLQSEIQQHLATISDLEQQISVCDAAHRRTQSSLDNSEAALSKARCECESAKQAAAIAQSREASALARLETVEGSRQELSDELQALKQINTARGRNLDDVTNTVQQRQRDVEQLKVQLDKARGALQDSEADNHSLRHELAETVVERDRALVAEGQSRSLSAELQGRINELAARKHSYDIEARDHAETKAALQRALDDLDAWDEERAALVRVHLTNQKGLEDERQSLLDTEVALRAEIHRIQQQHQEERRGDLSQVAMLADIRSDAAAVREHNEMLTAQIGVLQAALQKAEAEAQAHVDALEACAQEAASEHAASQQRLDELEHTATQLAQQLVEQQQEQERKFGEIMLAHAEELAAAVRAADARGAAELAEATVALQAQHEAVIAQMEADCREKIEVSADACASQVKKVQDACRERVELVEQQASMDAGEKEKSLREAYARLEQTQMEELVSMERKIVEQTARHRREAEQQLAEAAAVLGEEHRRILALQEERAKEEIAVLKEQLSALAQTRREEIKEAAAQKERHAEQIKQLELRHQERMSGGGETARRAEEQLRQTHARELARVTDRMQHELEDALNDKKVATDKAEKIQKVAAAAAAEVQRLQDQVQQLDTRLSELASERSQLQAQLTTTHSQSSSGKDEMAAERAKAAALGKEVERLQLQLASKDAAAEHLKQVLL